MLKIKPGLAICKASAQSPVLSALNCLCFLLSIYCVYMYICTYNAFAIYWENQQREGSKRQFCCSFIDHQYILKPTVKVISEAWHLPRFCFYLHNASAFTLLSLVMLLWSLKSFFFFLNFHFFTGYRNHTSLTRNPSSLPDKNLILQGSCEFTRVSFPGS